MTPHLEPEHSQRMISAMSEAIETTPATPGKGRAVLGFLVWVAICFSAAALGGFFIPGDWYAQLKKPAWNPPNWLFGPVWTALYLMMAVAAWLIWLRGGWKVQRRPLGLFLLQLFFNALWSPLFFGLRSPALGLVDIVLLWVTLAGTLAAFWKVRPVAGWLLVPYLTWTTFAAVLNLALWQMNR